MEENQEKKVFELKEENWNQFRNLEDENIEIRSTAKELKEFIPKKAAAIDLFRQTKISRLLGFSMIAAVLIVAISSYFSIWGGAITAGIFAIYAAINIKKDMERISYLVAEYRIDPRMK